MALLRYAKTLAQVAKAAEGTPEFLHSRERSIRVVPHGVPLFSESTTIPELR